MITQQMEDDLFARLNTIFKPVFEMGEKEMELAAIWLDKPIELPSGKMGSRLAPGMLVGCSYPEVNVVGGKATHLITKCYGNINNTSLWMKAKRLDNNCNDIIVLK